MDNLNEIIKIKAKLGDLEEITSAINEINPLKTFPLMKTADPEKMKITFSKYGTKDENNETIMIDYFEQGSGGQIELPNQTSNTSYSGTGKYKCLHFDFKERKYCIRIKEDE